MNYTGEALALYAENLLKIGAGYVYGTYFSTICTDSLIEAKRLQYYQIVGSPFDDGANGYSYAKRCKKWNGKLVGDCVGVMKGHYWTDDSGRVRYKYLGRADTSANGLKNLATVKGLISSMPDRRGIVVWYNKHVGVYVGNGEVIESRGADYGVVKTKLSSRAWKEWFECPYLLYGGEDEMEFDAGQKNKLAIGMWQTILISLGYDLGAYGPNKDGIDLSYGPRGQAATLEFKKKYGLPANAKVDRSVLSVALKALKEKSSDCSAIQKRLEAVTIEAEKLENDLKVANIKISNLSGENTNLVKGLNKKTEDYNALVAAKDYFINAK